MGGPGSGNWWRWQGKQSTVEKSLVVAMEDLRKPLFVGVAGTLTWTWTNSPISFAQVPCRCQLAGMERENFKAATEGNCTYRDGSPGCKPVDQAAGVGAGVSLSPARPRPARNRKASQWRTLIVLHPLPCHSWQTNLGRARLQNSGRRAR